MTHSFIDYEDFQGNDFDLDGDIEDTDVFPYGNDSNDDDENELELYPFSLHNILDEEDSDLFVWGEMSYRKYS